MFAPTNGAAKRTGRLRRIIRDEIRELQIVDADGLDAPELTHCRAAEAKTIDAHRRHCRRDDLRVCGEERRHEA